MTVRISNAAARSAGDSITGLIDADANPGKLIVYGGARPADVDTAIGAQTVLVEFTLGKPAFNPAVDANNGGHSTANPVDVVQASATGTATFFRVFDGAGKAVFDGAVTDTTGNGDLKLSSTSVIQGIDVTVVSLTTTMPEGV